MVAAQVGELYLRIGRIADAIANIAARGIFPYPSAIMGQGVNGCEAIAEGARAFSINFDEPRRSIWLADRDPNREWERAEAERYTMADSSQARR